MLPLPLQTTTVALQERTGGPARLYVPVCYFKLEPN